MNSTLILAGDIGGTNSRLGLFDGQLKMVFESTTKNAGRASLQDVVREFLSKAPKGQIDRACFGVAGPVANGQVLLTNLNWQLDEHSLAADLKIPKVGLINDLVAHAEGVEVLKPEQLITLNEGVAVPQGARAIIAAGTGLGEAGLVWDSGLKGYHAHASEGGHADFSPRGDLEIALLRFLAAKKNGAVSWEHVLSGPGTRNIYDFFISPGQMGPTAALSNSDPTPADITQAGLAGTNKASVATIDLFVALYGAEAGNLALKFLAVGGVYIGGGIGMKIADHMKQPVFLERFRDRGPDKLRQLLTKIPIHLINFDQGALLGAANYARRL